MIAGADTEVTDAETGFLDVAANALAVIILVTMVVLIISGVPQVRGEVTEETDLDLSFPPPLESVTTPLAAYYAVTPAGVTELDLDAMTSQVSEGVAIPETNQGDLAMRVSRSAYRDFNEYTAEFRLNLENVSNMATPVDTEEQRSAFVEMISSRFENQGVVPTFLIQRDAVADFAPLYWELRTVDAVLRWATLNPNDEIKIRHKVDSFSTRERRWQ
jgi:hypothetical protein